MSRIMSMIREKKRIRNQMDYESFCGGIYETNCYVLHAPEGAILFDAPAGTCDWAVSRNLDIKLLLLTHGHFDHVPDVAKVKKRFGCPIGCHPVTGPMISDPDFFKSFGFQLEMEPATPDFFIEETPERDFLGLKLQVLEVPGHCPGSLCFLWREKKLLVGGDVLFAGGVGRSDLPGGDSDLLYRGIREKLYALGDDVTVLPGHGPPTTVGQEKRTNPFVASER